MSRILFAIWMFCFMSLVHVVAQDDLGDMFGDDDDDGGLIELDAPEGLASLEGEARQTEVRRLLRKPTAADVRDLGVILTGENDSIEDARRAFAHLMHMGGAQRAKIGRKATTLIVPEYRMMGALLLGASGDKSTEPALIALGRDDDEALVQYGVMIALGQIGTTASHPLLKTWADEDPLARLSLCLTSDYSTLEQVMADVDVITKERATLLHELEIASLTGWSPHQVAAARQRLRRMNSHLELVPVLLSRLPDGEARRVAHYVLATPGSELANVLFIQGHTIVSAANLPAFLPLIVGANLELAEQLARTVHRLHPDQRAALATHLAALDRDTVMNRVLRVRLADIGDADTRLESLREGIADPSEWVVIEALDRVSAADVTTLRPTLLDAATTWQTEPRVAHRLAIIGIHADERRTP